MARSIYRYICDQLSHILAEVTVEPVMFLYMFTNFLYFPILQSLIFDKVCLADFDTQFCSQLRNDSHNPHYHHVNAQTSHWILMTSICLTIPSTFAVLLFYGALGDKIGRKVPVILPCVGAMAAYLSALLNAHFMSGSLYYILIGPIINGFCGGVIACLMAVYSYVGHIATDSSRMLRISIVESSIFLAGTIGVFLSGVVLDSIGYQYTCVLLIGAISIALIYSVVYLENVKVNQQSNVNKKSCTSLISSYMKESIQCMGKRRGVRVFSTILLQVICIDIIMFCSAGDMDITFLYLRERLGYDQVLYGYYKGLDNFLRGFTLITLPRLVKYCFHVNDLVMVLVGITSFMANFIVLGFSSTKWMAFLASVVGMLKGFPSAGLRSKMSSMVSQNEQGRLFGLIAATENIIMLLASVLFNDIFPATYDIFPGLCYLIGAGFLLFSFILVVYIMRVCPQEEEVARYDAMDQDDDDVEILTPDDDAASVQI